MGKEAQGKAAPPSLGAGGGKGPPVGYFAQTRDLFNSFLLVLPLLLLYQVGLFFTDAKTLNGADIISILLLSNFGWKGLLGFTLLLVVSGFVGLVVVDRKKRLDVRLAAPMIVESTVYAFLLGIVVTQILARIGVGAVAIAPALDTGPAAQGLLERVLLSVGAGVNEEFVFRLGLLSALVWAGQKLMAKNPAVLVAVGVSSLLFSLAHYMGPEPFAVYSFLYRFIAGVLFCALFWLRGFAVAVYTHAIYDVLVMVVFARE